MTGLVASNFTVTDTGAAAPPSELALQVSVMPGVSEDTVVAPQPVVCSEAGESGSLTLNEIVTGDTYHPLSPVAAGTLATIDGGVGSLTFTVVVVVLDAPVASVTLRPTVLVPTLVKVVVAVTPLVSYEP